MSTKKVASLVRTAGMVSADSGRSRNGSASSEDEDEVELNIKFKEPAMNFIANISNHIKSIELKADPVIIRVNEFSEESANEFANEISRAQNTGQSVIPVVIDSYGGQVYSLMSMIGAIKSSRIPVATIIEGKAMSCGAILFSFGSQGHRYMDPDATLMIHDVSSSAWGKIEELKANTREAERLNEKVYKMMARNCGKPENYFVDIIHSKGHSDWYLDVDEATTHGLVNHKKIPALTLNVTMNF